MYDAVRTSSVFSKSIVSSSHSFHICQLNHFCLRWRPSLLTSAQTSVPMTFPRRHYATGLPAPNPSCMSSSCQAQMRRVRHMMVNETNHADITFGRRTDTGRARSISKKCAVISELIVAATRQGAM